VDCIDPALNFLLYNQRLFVKGSIFLFLLRDIHEVPDLRHPTSCKELQCSDILINKWTRSA
jgi:hypothetical protein